MFLNSPLDGKLSNTLKSSQPFVKKHRVNNVQPQIIVSTCVNSFLNNIEFDALQYKSDTNLVTPVTQGSFMPNPEQFSSYF